MAFKRNYMKIALIGDGSVGKTALRERYIGGSFQATYLMTIGADFAAHRTKINDKEIRFQIWDLAGQPRFDTVRSIYYRGTSGALVVFDVTRIETMRNVAKWVDECFQNTNKIIPLVLLANKTDLRESDPLSVTIEQGKGVAAEIARSKRTQCDYLETSAKTGENVARAFELLAENILNS